MYIRPLYSNFARTTLASGINTTDTTLTVTTGHGARFPLPLRPGDFIPLILQKPDYSYEIVWATARSTDTFTIIREQEGTTGLSFSAGHLCINVLTSKAMDLFMNTYWGREQKTPTYVDATSFTLPGDETTRYQQRRAISLYQTTDDRGWVLSSTYDSGTGLTTVVGDNITVDSGLVGLDFGLDRDSSPKYTTRVSEADLADLAYLADDSLLLNGKSDQFLVPTGGIIMWSGAVVDIPTGWLLCDGTSGTPDLRGRFIIGAGGSYAVGATANGTVPSHTHTGPSHTHGTGSLSTNSTGAHTHSLETNSYIYSDIGGVDLLGHSIQNTVPDRLNSYYMTGWSGGTDTATLRAVSNGSHSHSVSGSTAASGTGNTGTYGTGSEVIAKYYALCYIMKS